jgi:hypothetical protein
MDEPKVPPPTPPASFDSLIVPPEPPPVFPSQPVTEKANPPVFSSGNAGKIGKKKISTGPIIATLLFLLITLPLSIMFISSRNQLSDVRSRAEELYPKCHTGAGFACCSNDPTSCGGHPDQCHCQGGDLCTGTVCEPNIETSCRNQGRSWCDNMNGFGKTCCVVGYTCCSGMPGCCNGGGPPPNDTPTSTPITGQCKDITVYKGTDVVTDLNSLKPGDVIDVAVKGVNATQAHVRYNGSSYELITTKNAQNEYRALPFTIPNDKQSITIEAEVYVNGVWK